MRLLEKISQEADVSMLLAARCLTSYIIKQGPRNFTNRGLHPSERTEYLEMKVSPRLAESWKEWGLRLGHVGRRGFIAWCVETAFDVYEWGSLVEYLKSRPDIQEAFEICRKISSTSPDKTRLTSSLISTKSSSGKAKSGTG